MPTTANYGWTTPVATNANDVPVDLASLASQIEGDLAAVEDLLTDAWSTYTPTWTDGTSTLSVGSGSISGRWKKIGSLVHFIVYFQRHANSNIGGANPWVFSLPVSARAYPFVQGSGWITLNGKNLPLSVVSVAGGTVGLMGPTGRIGNTYPGSWGAELIVFGGTYEVAP